MGSGLQCPACKHIHSLDEVGGAQRFRCLGCNKLLSAPAVPARTVAAGDTAVHPRVPSGGSALDSTAAMPRADRADGHRPVTAPPAAGPTGAAPPGGAAKLDGAAPRHRRPPLPKPLPASVRVLVWLLALPVGFVAAAVPLRALGLLDLDDAIDAFASTSLSRFAVLLVLLPLWAAMSAGLAHLLLELATRRRNRRRALRPTPQAGPR